MTLEQCYGAMGADYGDVFGRLRSERLIQKFVLKFLDDKSYELLCSSLESGNNEDAFRAAHTIKGMCQNLGFSVLARSSSALTEALRNGPAPEAGQLFEQVKADYALTVSSIEAYKAGLEA